MEIIHCATMALQAYAQLCLSASHSFPESLSSLLSDAWPWIALLTVSFTSIVDILLLKDTREDAERLKESVLSSSSTIFQSIWPHAAAAQQFLLAQQDFIHKVLLMILSTAARRTHQGMGLQNPPSGGGPAPPRREPLGTLEMTEGGDVKRVRR